MKKILALVLFGISMQSIGQVVDDFSDGDFTSNPIWSSNDLTLWTVVSGQLRSNSAAASSSFFISTPSTRALNAQWEFFTNLQFNTSGANFVDVYLTSEQSNPAAAGNNGYFVRIGGAPDEVSLYKLTNGVASILINGVDGITNSSNNTLKIKVIRSASHVWTLERDLSGSGNNYVMEGSVTDNAFTTSSFFVIRITQSTSTFHFKHFFDNLYAGNIIVEAIPPSLQAIQVNSANNLTLTFSEILERTSAETLLHYIVDNGIGQPQSAFLLPDLKSVSLTFTNSFTNGVTNQLSLSGVTDVVGNVITPASSSFLYFVAQPAAAFDLVINEFLADPSPQIGLPAVEFLELYNRSSKPFDLLSWKLSDPSSTASLPSYILLPNSYLILTSTASAASLAPFGNVLGLANFPTLNNSGDAIKLTDATGLKIDSVNYSIAWFQDADKEQGGWTLERLNPEVNSNEPTNWQPSVHASGGTPGKQNSVFGKNPDSTPPVLQRVDVISPRQLILVFNEALHPAIVSGNHFVVNNAIGSPSLVSLQADQKSVILDFEKAFQNGVDHVLTISEITDVAGNIMATTDKTFRYFVAAPIGFKDVILTEIMADPSPVVQLAEAEYIEIHNRTEGPFDIGGWRLSDATGTAVLPAKIIFPKSYLILTSTSNVSKFSGSVVGVTSFPSLNNGGEPLALRTAGNQLIDSVNYANQWYRDDEKEEGGWSLELIDLQNTCGEEDNWIASENVSGGTPGQLNSVNANKPDLTGPKLLSVTVTTANQLQLTFNEKLNSSLTSVEIVLSPAAGISSINFTSSSLRELRLTLSGDLATRVLYTLNIRNLRDCAGNVIDENFDEYDFALTEDAAPLDVVIHEILFNPRSGGVDFVELYNRSDKFINLKNFQLSNLEEGIIKNSKSLAASDFILRPHAFIVLTPNQNVLASHYPGGDVASFFESDLPSLPDDEGSVALSSSVVIIDGFLYTREYHHALLKDDEGVSLERISVDDATQNPFNWKSATAQSGFATPGLVNSNSRPEFLQDENTIIIEPEIFSPSMGFAKINYRFEQAGMSATVTVLDAQGRPIRQLANNEPIGFEGFFRWDGDQDDGTRARAGYYTIWMELFDLSGTVKQFRKRVVISAQ